MKVRNQSEKIYDLLCDLIPGGVSSPVRAFKEIGITPLVVDQGKGDTIWDVDGHSYIDYCCSWGSLIHGHAHENIVEAVCLQMQRGSSFGITTPMEQRLAEKIRKHVPSMEKIRFVSSGTEATMSAIRLARGYTGKSTIIKFNGNYHGHADMLLVAAGSGATNLPKRAATLGIPEDTVKNTVSLPYNDIETCKTFLRKSQDVAAVILEPFAANMGLVQAGKEFLTMLREETKKKGILLIIDEVVTGFRVGLSGVQGYYGIEPDLTCLGKIIGGGLPAAAFGGRREIMDRLSPLGPVFQAGTLSGNPLAMAAGYIAIKDLEGPNFFESLHEKAEFLLGPIQEYIEKKQLDIFLSRFGSMFTIFFGIKNAKSQEDVLKADGATFRRFFLYLLQRGIYISPSVYEVSFVSAAHSWENLEKTRTAILEFLHEMD